MTKIMEKGNLYINNSHKRSLNKETRKRDLIRITMENQAILKRLQEKQSNYNVFQWEKQRVQNERLVEKISEYPFKLYDGQLNNERLPTEIGQRRKKNLPSIRSSGWSLTRKVGNRRNLNTQQDFYKNRQGLTGTVREAYTSAQKASNSPQQDVGGMVNLDSGRHVFAKKARMLSSGYFIIEISKTDTMFFIAAIKKRNSNENYLIELEWEKAKEILKQFRIQENEGEIDEIQFEELFDSLEILDNRLVLLNPKIKQQKGARGKKRAKTRGSQSQPRIRQNTNKKSQEGTGVQNSEPTDHVAKRMEEEEKHIVETPEPDGIINSAILNIEAQKIMQDQSEELKQSSMEPEKRVSDKEQHQIMPNKNNNEEHYLKDDQDIKKEVNEEEQSNQEKEQPDEQKLREHNNVEVKFIF